ncbi:MAG: hypothetical protein WCJ60_02360 [bacterium]
MSTVKLPKSIASKNIKAVGQAKVVKTGVTKHMPGCGNVGGCKC